MKSSRRTEGFRAHIEKRRRRGWFCITREFRAVGAVSVSFSAAYGPFSKRDAKVFKASAKKGYVESRKG